MNPILVQQMADHRIDGFERERAADRRAALAGRPATGSFVARERASITSGWLRLVRRGSAA